MRAAVLENTMRNVSPIKPEERGPGILARDSTALNWSTSPKLRYIGHTQVEISFATRSQIIQIVVSKIVDGALILSSWAMTFQSKFSGGSID